MSSYSVDLFSPTTFQRPWGWDMERDEPIDLPLKESMIEFVTNFFNFIPGLQHVEVTHKSLAGHYFVTESLSTPSTLETIAKVALCFTVVVPLIILLAHLIIRSVYTFEFTCPANAYRLIPNNLGRHYGLDLDTATQCPGSNYSISLREAIDFVDEELLKGRAANKRKTFPELRTAGEVSAEKRKYTLNTISVPPGVSEPLSQNQRWHPYTFTVLENITTRISGSVVFDGNNNWLEMILSMLVEAKRISEWEKVGSRQYRILFPQT
ncbi:MAG: hypothetical protein HYX48_03390 [Chlamydiales bacterium]|nr:hypothetical protein [Chlamydiales bacterium]